MYKLLLDKQEFKEFQKQGKLKQILALIGSNRNKIKTIDFNNNIYETTLTAEEYFMQKNNDAFYCPITHIKGTLIKEEEINYIGQPGIVNPEDQSASLTRGLLITDAQEVSEGPQKLIDNINENFKKITEEKMIETKIEEPTVIEESFTTNINEVISEDANNTIENVSEEISVKPKNKKYKK